MFDLQQVHAYRSVKAPQALREQVLRAHIPARSSRQRGAVSIAAALAACLILVFGLSQADFGRGELLLMGEPLKEGQTVVLGEMTPPQGDAVSFARQVEPDQRMELELEVKLKEPAALEVSGGSAVVLKDGEVQTDLTALEGEITVVWEVDPAQQDELFQLTLCGEDSCRTISLGYEEDQGGWIARTHHKESRRNQS